MVSILGEVGCKPATHLIWHTMIKFAGWLFKKGVVANIISLYNVLYAICLGGVCT